MQIKLSIILDSVRSFRTEEHLSANFNPAFSLCLPLPEEPVPLQDDCLYVGLLSAAMKAQRNADSTVILCLRDRYTDEYEIDGKLKNLIIVNENISSFTLLSLVQERFYSVVRWKQDMDQALLNNCSMQELVDMCPPMLNNYIQITDASFVKLAQTTKFDCDCPLCQNLKKYGYHPEESVARFRKFHLFDVWARLDDKIYYDESTDVAKYPTLHRVFKFHGNYYAHVVMTCNNEPCTQSMMDLFQILVDELRFCVERDWENKFSCVHPYDNFFLDLIEGKIASESELNERASRIGFPTEGRFYILHLMRAPEQNAPMGTILKDFSSEFPRFKFINYESSITAFIHATDLSRSEKGKLQEDAERFLDRHNCFCGVSTSFEKLSGSVQAFRQSRLALKYGLEMRHKSRLMPQFPEYLPSDTRIYSFTYYFPFCLFGGEPDSTGLWYNSVYHEKLKSLYQKDLRHGTDDLLLLITYLRHERKNTEVACVLNMHRNTVIYRIKHIEEYLSIDLDDERTRILLMYSFLAAEYFGFSD